MHERSYNAGAMRYLDLSATVAAMPSFEEQLRLAEESLVGVESGGQVPGKIAVHPRPPDSIAYAMPAIGPPRNPAEHPPMGVKWVTVFPANSGRGLPTVDSLVILNDPLTLEPTDIMNGAAITAARTAAVSGVIIRQFGQSLGPTPGVALVGAGVQGRSHLEMLGKLLPAASVRIFDRHPDRRGALVEAAHAMGIKRASPVQSAQEAMVEADVIITTASFGPERQLMDAEWLRPRCVVIAVDYDVYLSAKVARSASIFLVDELRAFANARVEGRFAAFPEPFGTIGGRLLADHEEPSPDRIVVAHLGMGLTDVLFADAVASTARSRGLGVELPHSGAADQMRMASNA